MVLIFFYPPPQNHIQKPKILLIHSSYIEFRNDFEIMGHIIKKRGQNWSVCEVHFTDFLALREEGSQMRLFPLGFVQNWTI